jgi:hypothetical protein
MIGQLAGSGSQLTIQLVVKIQSTQSWLHPPDCHGRSLYPIFGWLADFVGQVAGP